MPVRLLIYLPLCWLIAIGMPVRGQPSPLAPAYTYAVMSQLAYEPRNPNSRDLLASDWEEFARRTPDGENDDQGYFGIAFVNHATRQVVIAHRGTDQLTITRAFSRSIDLDDDLALLRGRVPGQFQHSTRPFISAVYARMFNEGLEDYAVSHTGHSLGASLAVMSAADEPVTAAVVFDSPGAPLGEGAGRPLIVSYLAAPNLINTVNRHFGRVVLVDGDWLSLRARFFPQGFSGLLAPPVFITSYIRFSLESHSLTRILATFDPDTGEPRRGTDSTRWWPLGVLSSFRNFLFPNRALNAIRSVAVDPLEFFLRSLNRMETEADFQNAVDEYVIRSQRLNDNLSDLYTMAILTMCDGSQSCMIRSSNECFVGATSLSFMCVRENAE